MYCYDLLRKKIIKKKKMSREIMEDIIWNHAEMLHHWWVSIGSKIS